VRAYRLGHQAMVGMIADEVRTLNLDPALGRDVFEWMTEVTFRPAAPKAQALGVRPMGTAVTEATAASAAKAVVVAPPGAETWAPPVEPAHSIPATPAPAKPALPVALVRVRVGPPGSVVPPDVVGLFGERCMIWRRSVAA
ncbi:hypothetical protein BV508_28720, partial [Mycobacterium intermedium]